MQTSNAKLMSVLEWHTQENMKNELYMFNARIRPNKNNLNPEFYKLKVQLPTFIS